MPKLRNQLKKPREQLRAVRLAAPERRKKGNTKVSCMRLNVRCWIDCKILLVILLFGWVFLIWISENCLKVISWNSYEIRKCGWPGVVFACATWGSEEGLKFVSWVFSKESVCSNKCAFWKSVQQNQGNILKGVLQVVTSVLLCPAWLTHGSCLYEKFSAVTLDKIR